MRFMNFFLSMLDTFTHTFYIIHNDNYLHIVVFAVFLFTIKEISL